MQPGKEGSGVPRRSLWECISGAVCRMLRRDVLACGGAWMFRFRWVVGLLVIALLVFGKVHGFSLRAWDVLFPEMTTEYSFPSVGLWCAIQSDEWQVSTPAVLAQCAHPEFFPRINVSKRAFRYKK